MVKKSKPGKIFNNEKIPFEEIGLEVEKEDNVYENAANEEGTYNYNIFQDGDLKDDNIDYDQQKVNNEDFFNNLSDQNDFINDEGQHIENANNFILDTLKDDNNNQNAPANFFDTLNEEDNKPETQDLLYYPSPPIPLAAKKNIITKKATVTANIKSFEKNPFSDN